MNHRRITITLDYDQAMGILNGTSVALVQLREQIERVLPMPEEPPVGSKVTWDENSIWERQWFENLGHANWQHTALPSMKPITWASLVRRAHGWNLRLIREEPIQ